MNERPTDPTDPTDPTGPTDPITPGPSADAPPGRPSRRAGRPLSVSAVSIILLVVGGGIEGYAVALSAGDLAGRQYSLVWALLGAALVVTAWALRGRRWWGAAAAIGVSIVGLVAGMFGVYGALLIASAATDDQAAWLTTVGLIGVGGASIAIIGLLSSAWPWLTATAPRPPLTGSSTTA
jgi:hypothetical protein